MKTIAGFLLALLVFISAIGYAEPGDTVWTHTYGGSADEWAQFITQTSDGGYVVVGNTESYGSGELDFFLVKTDIIGDTMWTRTYGGNYLDLAFCVQQVSDGGFIVAGATEFSAGGYSDCYLIRTDSLGELIWDRTYGGSSYEEAHHVEQTPDNGFIIGGITDSYGAGDTDIYLVKTDFWGDTAWTKTYGGVSSECVHYLQLTSDGGYIMAGYTNSFGSVGSDFYLVKTNSAGDTNWTRVYDITGWDEAFCVKQTSDNGYIVAGFINDYGPTDADIFVMKTDYYGDSLWTKTYGSDNTDYAYSIEQMRDDGYIICGYTDNLEGAGYDFYLIRTDTNGDTIWTRTYGGIENDEAYSVKLTSDGGYIIAGQTFSYGAGQSDFYVIKVEDEMNIFQYLPGDCNMSNGEWPPEVLGSDVIRLLSYLLGLSVEPCFMFNSTVPEQGDSLFYAAADVNGDCKITGSDGTYLFAYLGGLHSDIKFCPYYPPAWLSEDDLPPDPPPDWPDCLDAPEWDYAGPFESSPDPDVIFWFGHPDSSSIYANIGEVFTVDIYVQTSDSTCGGDIHVPLGLNTLYGNFSDTDDEYHYPFTEWDGHGFTDPVDSPPNPPGWSSISFMGWRYTNYPTENPCLNSDVPLKILTFYIEAAMDSDLVDSTIYCLAVGAQHDYWTLSVGDTLGLSTYPVAVNILPVTFSLKTYFYLPGDINMYYGNWPPLSVGSDFTHLTDYFSQRPGGEPCYLLNPQAPDPPDTLFWASADVNGDCRVTSSDLIYWTHWVRGYHSTLHYCPYYPPAWPTVEDVPPDPPVGWPFCYDPPAEVYIDPFESSPDPAATFWYGHPDSSYIPAIIGETFAVDIYIQTSGNTYAGDYHVPLGANNQYISAFVDTGSYYYPLTEWYDAPSFLEPVGSPPNPPGWSSKSVHGWSNVQAPYTDPWLHSLTPIKILTFYVTAANDTSLVDSTIDCLNVGSHPTFQSLDLGDMWGLGSLPVAANVLPVKFMQKTYEYLPGDANMRNESWPPQVIGGDVTYLVNYFRGMEANPACIIGGFYCAADVNGDCSVIGSDVTKLVNYFRGQTTLSNCPAYPPAWPPLPPSEPPGWPNCATQSGEYQHEDIRGECNAALQDSGYMVLEVDGNDLHILHFNAYYNCCLNYNVDYNINGFYITATEYLTGEPCYCMCYFDLESILFDLQPGLYTVCLINADGDTVGVDTVTIGEF